MEEQIKCEIIKSQITLLDRFYRVIGDGYNPANISFSYNLKSKIEPESIFINKSHNDIGEPWYYQQNILPSKEVVINLSHRLKELLEWNMKHVVGFEQILKSEYRMAEFSEIYQVIYEQIIDLTSGWNSESTQFLIDTKDGSYRKFLFISETSKSMVFEFGNYIH
jgi:hypothetical protein